MRQVVMCFVALAIGCSRSNERSTVTDASTAPPPTPTAYDAPPRPPVFDGGGADVLTGSPTQDLDRTIFDALRRDAPKDLEPLSVRPLQGDRFDKARQNLLVGAAKFRRSVQTEDGLEVIYDVLQGAHELHLLYVSRGTMKLTDAWIFAW